MGLQAHQGHKGKNSEEGWSREKRTDKCAKILKDAMREKRELTKEETESEETEWMGPRRQKRERENKQRQDSKKRQKQ